MAETNQPRTTFRSIGAVLTGMIVGIALTIVTDIVLHATHFFPPWGDPVTSAPLVAATAYRIVYSVLASYVVTRLAPNRPMRHALAGGFIGFAVSIIGAL